MPDLPLRERKKAAAMRRIQAAAISLFTKDGFGAVTVEQVAAAAEVSPSTVYRYFGTKEGLVLHDEYDERIINVLIRELSSSDQPALSALRAALADVETEQFVRDREATLARTKLWLEVDSIQAATYPVLAQYVEMGAQMLAASGRMSINEGRIVVSAVIGALIYSVVNWYRDGADRPWNDYAEEAISLLETRLPSI